MNSVETIENKVTTIENFKTWLEGKADGEIISELNYDCYSCPIARFIYEETGIRTFVTVCDIAIFNKSEFVKTPKWAYEFVGIVDWVGRDITKEICLKVIDAVVNQKEKLKL